MEKGLIIIPYANKMAYQGGVNLKNSDASKSVDVYLKNCCVACISAITNSGGSADVALITNIEVPNPYRDLLTANGVKIIVAEFDDFDFGGNYLWGLAFYKLCALKAALRVTNYKYYAYMDSDVFVQSDFRNIWNECDERILMYDICHGLQVEHYRHLLAEIELFNDKISGGGYERITHYGGEFVAANRELALQFVSECQKIYDLMMKIDFKTTHGDEFIISLAATKLNVKNAGAYVYRFWTGSFRLVSTCYKYNPVIVLHVPAEKDYGMLKIYSSYLAKDKFPTNVKAHKLLHLTRKSLRTVAAQTISKFRK